MAAPLTSRLSFVAALAVLAGAVPSPALAQRGEPTKNHSRVLEAFRVVVAKPSASVVRVLSGGKEVALGTVVGADGWVLTKHSQLRDDAQVKLSDGKELSAKIVGVSDEHDLALLKVEAKGLVAIEWRTSKNAGLGDWVVAVGPGKDPIAVGVVSVATRAMARRDYPPATNPNSGFLGVTPSDESRDGGVKIEEVQENSAASKAGIKPGDVIMAINNKLIPDRETLLSTLARYRPKDEVTVRIKRESKEQELKAILGARPAGLSRGDVQNRMGNTMSDRRTGFPAILQHDTLLTPTQCGSPLVDLDGKAIGLNIARAGRIESYAIPSENVLALLDELKSGKSAPAAVADPTKRVILEKAVQAAEEKVAQATERLDAARNLVKNAEETAERFGKDNPELLEARDKARKFAQLSEQALNTAKADLQKAKAELDRSRK